MNSTAVILAFASLATVQSLSDLPQCAQECLADAITANSECTIDDIVCVCDASTYQYIVTASTPCVVSRCGADVAVDQVLPAAASACNAISEDDGPDSAGSSDIAIVSGAFPSVFDSASSTTSVDVFISPTATRRVATTHTADVTSAIVIKNGTFVATSTVIPVTVNGAAVQYPRGIFAALALATLAYL